MQSRADGDFDVEPSEKITFKVTRKNPLNKATINPRQGWASCVAEQQPDDKTKIRACTAPLQGGASCTTTIGVDFRNDDQGTFDPDDTYTVTVSGSAGGSDNESFSPPPVLNTEDFVFHVKGNAQ